MTYHPPNMKSYTQSEVEECNSNCKSEFIHQDSYQPRLEYVGVEEQKKNDNDRKHNADILNAGTKKVGLV